MRRSSAATTRYIKTMIRPYQASEKDVILHIWKTASTIAHPFLSAEQVAEAEAMIRDQFLDMAEVWVAEADQSPVGFIALIEAEVGGLFVLPDHQGQGHGKRLLDLAVAKRGGLTLGVFAQNQQARAFYEAYGFAFEEERMDAFFGHQEVRMRLTP